ncbi:predicted protein [Uncinocarpus reesii 1704]|uniref:Uncharacterized protein n=1 Tax=Uncinocarpus reesii (strain UAMH 1704) TaxID=336963 RepID=C4JZ28_UNCRE|nr:uncharacterized protein UREG_07429 [Uncinocarpus reesii 1704]EEP82564.1 predicted protein [Uncinocarpus reesii 1704]
MAKLAKRAPPKKLSTTIPADAESPAAFTQAPSSLSDFLADFSPTGVYLIHIDRHPQSEKRQIFILPLILNLLILALVLYRIYTGIHTYPDILAAILGHDSPARIDPKTASWALISTTLARRTVTFLFDYLLITLFLPWPVRFLSGPARWRWEIGFQRAEIIVRKSRDWSEALGRTWIRDDEETMKERVIPAITPLRLRKTGYLLIDADWDLDFAAMTRAHRDLKAGRIRLDDFETAVVVHGGGNKGWLIWRPEDVRGSSGQGANSSVELSPSERDRIVAFQEKLASMGKEDLFYRWVEIIQFESTQPGGFTPERQQRAMADTKKLFESRDVDFEKFWADVGGMQGVSI